MLVTAMAKTGVAVCVFFANFAVAIRTVQNDMNEFTQSRAANEVASVKDYNSGHAEFVTIPTHPSGPNPIVSSAPMRDIRRSPSTRTPPIPPLRSAENGRSPSIEKDLLVNLRPGKKDTNSFVLTETDVVSTKTADGALSEAKSKAEQEVRDHEMEEALADEQHVDADLEYYHDKEADSFSGNDADEDYHVLDEDYAVASKELPTMQEDAKLEEHEEAGDAVMEEAWADYQDLAAELDEFEKLDEETKAHVDADQDSDYEVLDEDYAIAKNEPAAPPEIDIPQAVEHADFDVVANVVAHTDAVAQADAVAHGDAVDADGDTISHAEKKPAAAQEVDPQSNTDADADYHVLDDDYAVPNKMPAPSTDDVKLRVVWDGRDSQLEAAPYDYHYHTPNGDFDDDYDKESYGDASPNSNSEAIEDDHALAKRKRDDLQESDQDSAKEIARKKAVVAIDKNEQAAVQKNEELLESN